MSVQYYRSLQAHTSPPKMPSQPESRYWMFTLNNYEKRPEDAEPLSPYLTELMEKGVSFLVYSEEKGETPHLQGYLELATKKRLSAVKKLPGLGRCHFEVRRGSQNDAIAYCSKTADPTFVAGPYRHGEPVENNQGKRTDLLEVQRKLREGADLASIAEEHFGSWCRYNKAFAEYATLIKKPDAPTYGMDTFRWPPEKLDLPLLLWGPTNTGKTQYALAHFASPLLIRHIDDLLGFNPKVHDGIVFDDMDFKHWPAQSVIHLLDIDLDTAINVRYRVARIPKGTPRIFTFNDSTPLEGPLNDQHGKSPYPSAQLQAIRRRYRSRHVPEQLFGIPESPPVTPEFYGQSPDL